ncbi:copper homeostasis protein CutC [Salinicoccus hispanicus]|uniref:Copper homeostasis protein cutC homolog n=1 Tax=Salinicoccus hispanicus TaxID=157225 RepID=A0A6N8U473_9STAP|nr:copper homeostasis protein CutC [Salinicoccus hispanicus]MXQ51041.1 copper homeostasis protein CutC [Salinicoccus hispanicus]
MIIEGIATNLKDVENLNSYGVDRIELCESMDQDGLTPDLELVRRAVLCSDIPINVMVRLDDHSFHYNSEVIEKMAEQIEVIKSHGVNGIVIGALTTNHMIDTEALEQLLAPADEMEVTFHKAFDEVEDQSEALETLSQYPQIKTVLTSGGKGSATDNIEQLLRLTEKADGTGITIMPGGGLKVDNIDRIFQSLKPGSMHFGTGIRHNGSYDHPVSKEKILLIKELVSDG